MSKYLDSDGLLYLWSKIKTLVSGKVDKADGKGLSTNDYTTAEKQKLAGLSNYTLPTASAETLGGVKVGAGLSINSGVLSATGGGTADAVDWSNVQNKPSGLVIDTNYVHTDNNYTSGEKAKLAAFGEASAYALKTDIASAYKYKGSKANYAALPSAGNEIGDVWNVEDTGMNYAWTGTAWDALGQLLEIQSITNGEIDAIAV